MKHVATVYTVLLALLCWSHYPLAVFTPHGTKSANMVFYFEFPHLFSASVLSSCFLFVNLSKLNWSARYLQIATVALGFMSISAFIGNSFLFRFIESASFIAVPLAMSLAFKDERNKTIAITNLAFLFVLNLLYCLSINDNIGIAGNQNWLAATLLSSAPFFYLTINKLPRKTMVILGVAALIGSIRVLWLCEARSIIPAIIFYGLFLSFHHLNRKQNILIYACLIVCAIGLFILKGDRIKRAYNADIRGPLTQDTTSMSLASPIFGHGPGNFQKDFPRFASDTLKQRPAYSAVSEHPHNELLHIIASSGAVVALCYLFMLLTLLEKKKSPLIRASQFAICCLLLMALADKPLVVSPSALIFLIASAFCLPQNTFRANLEDRHPPALKYVGLALTLLISSFFIASIKQKVSSEYYFWQAEINRQRLSQSGNLQKYIPEIMKMYAKSSDLDTQSIKAAHAATSVSLQYYNDLGKSQIYLERALQLEPDYSDLHYQKGFFYQKSAQLLKSGKDKNEYLREAEKEFLANVQASPWDLKRQVNLIKFYASTGVLHKCAEWILKLRNTVRQKSQIRYTTRAYHNQEASFHKWQKDVLNKVYSPTPGVYKYNHSGDYLFPAFLTKTKNLQHYSAEIFNGIDYHFWRQQLSIWKMMQASNLKSTADLMAWASKLKISEEPLNWPLKTMQSQQGNAMSLAALACCINRLLGHESAILRDEDGGLVCVLFSDEGEPYFWNCQSGLQIRAKIDSFHQSIDLQKQMGLAKTELSYSLFTYPQAFCFRNQVLADAVSQAKNIPLICVSPTLSYIKTLTKIGQRKLSLLTDFRTLLDSQFKPGEPK